LSTTVRNALSILSQSDPWLFSLLWYYYATTVSRTNIALYKFIDSSTFKRKINLLLNKISSLIAPFGLERPPTYIWLESNKPIQFEHKAVLNYLRNEFSKGHPFTHPIRNETIKAPQMQYALWELKQNQPEYHSLINYYIKTNLKSASIAAAKHHDYGTLARRTAKVINMLTLYSFESELIPKKDNRIRIYPDSE